MSFASSVKKYMPFGLSIFGLFLASLCLAEPPITSERARLLEQAAARDPLKLSQPRADLGEHAFIGPFGVELHPSCFALAAAQGMDRDVVENGFSLLLYETYKNTADMCSENYPELEPYITEWIGQFVRTVITCSSKKSSELHFGAANFDVNVQVRNLLTPDERRGIDTKWYYRSLPRNHKTVVVYPSDVFFRSVTAPPRALSYYATILSHEVFHSTSANNRNDHNSIELIAIGSHGECADDVRSDRVNVISTICNGVPLHTGSKSTQVYLAAQMKTCGPARCEQLFSGDLNSKFPLMARLFPNPLPSRGLSPTAAQAVCTRISADASWIEGPTTP